MDKFIVGEKSFDRFQNVLKEIAPDVSITGMEVIETLKTHPNLFPYLVTRLAPCLYHIIVLPKLLLEEDQFYLAYNQFILNKLDTCLVLEKESSIFLSEKENKKVNFRPSGGKIIYGLLKPYVNDLENIGVSHYL